VFPLSGLKQARLGFAAAAPIAGKVGADEDVQNPASAGRHGGNPAAVDLLQGFREP